MSEIARVARVALVALLALAAPGAATAQMLTIAETEDLVRAEYFEGMPEEEAMWIGPAGARRLVEMLTDPEESRSHGQILLALGLCGSPDAMAAIVGRIEMPRTGEIDRDTFKAWQALPYALGHLARHDRRAIGQLERLMNADAPDWTFRHHRGARLFRLARRAAANSLAETGLPEARGALDRAGRDVSDARFQEHLQSVRALHAERARERAE
jgi:hypothetical protein